MKNPEKIELPELGRKVIMIGLDGEMSSADLATGGRLIQVGFSMLINGKIDSFTSNIGYPLESWDDTSWSERASVVHNIPREELADKSKSPSAEEVDEAASAWLLARGAVLGERILISIGFNVGAFDHPFFRKSLPKTMSLVSRRCIDLNAICFTLGGWDPNPANTARSWTGCK